MSETIEKKPMPTKVCRGCLYVLPLDHFGHAATPSDYCDICRDEKREAKAWTDEEIATLLATTKPIFDYWSRFLDHWTEEDLVEWRNFLAAAGREPLPDTISSRVRGEKQQQAKEALLAARTRIDENVRHYFAIRERWKETPKKLPTRTSVKARAS
jgi:hypothetical protein